MEGRNNEDELYVIKQDSEINMEVTGLILGSYQKDNKQYDADKYNQNSE